MKWKNGTTLSHLNSERYFCPLSLPHLVRIHEGCHLDRVITNGRYNWQQQQQQQKEQDKMRRRTIKANTSSEKERERMFGGWARIISLSQIKKNVGAVNFNVCSARTRVSGGLRRRQGKG
jgi:hypothetical protein